MVKKLLVVVIITTSFLVYGCGEKEKQEPPPVPQTTTEADIEQLETIETSEIPSLYDDEDLYLDDEEPAIEYDETTESSYPEEKDSAETDYVHDTEPPVTHSPEPQPDEVISQKDTHEAPREIAQPLSETKKEKPPKRIAKVIPRPEKRITSPSVKQEKTYEPSFSKSGKFYVYLATFKHKNMAVNLWGKYKYQYPTFIDEITDPTPKLKGTFYRVIIGSFATEDEAKKFGKNVLTAQGQSYWVQEK